MLIQFERDSDNLITAVFIADSEGNVLKRTEVRPGSNLDLGIAVRTIDLFRIVCRQFGYPMYAANVGAGWTDKYEEAAVYDHRDSAETKLKYWKAVAKNQGMDETTVSVER